MTLPGWERHLEDVRPYDHDKSLNHLWRAVRDLERLIMSIIDNETRLEGDITALTDTVTLLKNEYDFLKGRAEQGTVTTDDLAGFETALNELGALHPDVKNAVDQTTGIGTQGEAGSAAVTAPTTTEGEEVNPGPGEDVASNTGTPATAEESGETTPDDAAGADEDAI